MVRARADVREVAGPIPAQDHPILGSSVDPLTNLRRHQNMTDCRLEYMVYHPRVVGSSPTTSA